MENIETEKYKIAWDEENQIVRLAIIGEFNEKVARSFIDNLTALIGELKKKGVKKIHGIADASNAGTTPDFRMRKIFSEFLKSGDFKDSRVGMYGISGPGKMIVNFMFTAGGIKNVKFFNTEKEAFNWVRKK